MDIFTLDFETYYAKDYSLSGMTTEEYVRDPRFQAIMVSIKRNDEPVRRIPAEMIPAFMDKMRDKFSRSAVLAHNATFDGFILSHHYNVRPKVIFDTLAMGRAYNNGLKRNSLAALVEQFGLGVKGTEVLDALGKRLEDFTPAELEQYGKYCDNDVELTWKLFKVLLPHFKKSELKTISILTQMFTDPVLLGDAEMLERWVHALKMRKEQLLTTLGVTAEDLRSDAKFAKLLEPLLARNGLSIPMKVSPSTGKETFAFAKSDDEFTSLQEHDDTDVAFLVSARLGVKTSIAETRGARFAGIARRGTMPISIQYYGAGQTGRTSGGEKCNWQNLGRTIGIDENTPGWLVMTPQGAGALAGVANGEARYFLCEQGGKIAKHASTSKAKDCHLLGLRDMIRAQPGYSLVVVDSSNIEARVLATLSGQEDAVARFRNNEDPYCHMASQIYHRPITKADKSERMMGKVAVLALGYGQGAAKFKDTAKAWGAGEIDALEAKTIVDAFRSTYDKVVQFWRRCDNMFPYIAGGVDGVDVDLYGLIKTDKNGFRLPNGMLIPFYDLKHTADGWQFWGGLTKGRGAEKENLPTKAYGAKCVENFCQAISRIIVTEQMNKVAERYRVAWFIHDEIVLHVPSEQAEEALAYATEVMKTSPEWWPEVPLSAEGSIDTIYGRAK